MQEKPSILLSGLDFERNNDFLGIDFKNLSSIFYTWLEGGDYRFGWC
jgi:hypothetical protein